MAALDDGHGSKASRGPVRRSEKISSVLAREIVADVRGKPPLTMLPSENAMLETYRVGRSSLREALRILEVHGIIAIKPGPGGGPMVAPLDPTNFARMATLYLHLMGATYREVLEARTIIEPVMARLAAQRGDHATLAAVQEYLAEPDVVDESEYVRRAGGFHTLLSGLSGNRVLDLTGRGIRDLYVDRIEGMVFPLEERSSVVSRHRQIARAIAAGSAARAERLMREHMEEYLGYASARNPDILDDVIQWR